MDYFSSSQAADLWGISERSVRNYCVQGRVPGAFLTGKTWNIPVQAEKPIRTNARAQMGSDLLRRLREEKDSKLKGGIYHKIQVEMTYNSNRIEGSRLSLDQTRLIFETATIGVSDEPIRTDDIIETANHFRAIDYVIDHAQEPLSEGLMKELHRILKAGTTDATKSWFAVGDYKRIPNEVGGHQTVLPEDVPETMKALLADYRPGQRHALEEILEFHVRFERIHPFQDGNGRVGRLVMLKECLRSGIVPFVIADDMKLFYCRGLEEWGYENGYLSDTCLAAQDKFKAALDYFRIEY